MTGLKVGWAMDLCTTDEEGSLCDFTNAEMKNKAARKVVAGEPLVLIGSPPCIDWSSLMNLGWSEMDPEYVGERT